MGVFGVRPGGANCLGSGLGMTHRVKHKGEGCFQGSRLGMVSGCGPGEEEGVCVESDLVILREARHVGD